MLRCTVDPFDGITHVGVRFQGLTDVAVVPLPAVGADALVHADLVDAGAPVVARVALAVVDVWNGEGRVRFLPRLPSATRSGGGEGAYSRDSKCL